VNDSLAGAANPIGTLASLAAGASHSFDYYHTVTAADALAGGVHNVAAAAADELDDPVDDDETAATAGNGGGSGGGDGISDPPATPNTPDSPDTPDSADPPGTGSEPPESPAPGGNDPDIPPAPAAPGSRLVPADNGNFVEIGPDNVPLGEWRWDDPRQIWVFEEYPAPQGSLPQTGASSDRGVLYLGFLLLALGILALAGRSRYKGRHSG
jgi:LPXTG-motif cell wall-anchored protein